MATTDPTLPAGAVTPSQANQTTSNKATTLIESLVATPTLPTGTRYHHSYNKYHLMNY